MRKIFSPIMGDSFRCAVAMVVAAVMLPSCSDDQPGEFSGESNIETTSDGITVGNNPAEQADRVTFYGKYNGRSRAAADFPEVGDVPVMPAGIPSYSTPNAADQDWQNEARKTAYELTGGSGQIKLFGNTDLYITGDVQTHDINGSGTIYVMPQGSLTLTCNVQNVTIKAFGDLITGENRDITVGANAGIFVDDSFVVNGRFAVEGICVVNNSLTVHGQLQVSSSMLKAKCIYVDTDINMSGSGEISVGSYLETPILYLGGNATVDMYPNAMASVAVKTTMTSNSSRFVYVADQTAGQALLKTGELHVEGSADDPAYINAMFAHELKVEYDDLTNTQPAHRNDFLASVEDYRIPASGCNPGNADKEPEKPSFDQIAVIEPPTHDHDYLSATCVQDVNGKAYVSFHLNEEYADITDHTSVSRHQGCAEVYDVTEDHAQISSWLLNENHDFNHLIVDGDKMYTTGDMKGGARLGIIDLVNGQFGQQSATMSIVKLNGNSGNCIIRDGDSFRIATNLGFQSLDALTYLENSEFLGTSGSAKHIAKGNGVIVTLNLDERGVTSSSAIVNVYRNNWGFPTATFQVSNITPIDGKNVIAVDGNYIYVCLGENGVEKYDLNGQKVGGYNWKDAHPTSKGRPCANGLAVDDKYLYIAYGGAGLYVFDKQTMTQVARYYHRDEMTENTKYSANYVALVGKFIYISYGRNGLEVVKMNVPAI